MEGMVQVMQSLVADPLGLVSFPDSPDTNEGGLGMKLKH